MFYLGSHTQLFYDNVVVSVVCKHNGTSLSVVLRHGFFFSGNIHACLCLELN